MATQVLTCIRCPRGCQVELTIDEAGQITGVAGNSCKRGETYAKAELTNPVRTVTSTVTVCGGKRDRVVPVKTVPEVPKAKVKDVMEKVFAIKVAAPVAIGDVICEDIAGTGANLVATKDAS